MIRSAPYQGSANVQDRRCAPAFTADGGEQAIAIAFGESIGAAMKPLDEHVAWVVVPADDAGAPVQGMGDALRSHVFDVPGEYHISLHVPPAVPGTCGHDALPSGLLVTVAPVRMEFDIEAVQLSAPIHTGVPVDGIKMIVPVNVRIHPGGATIVRMADARTAGVGTTVVGRCTTPQMELSEGRHLLEYALSGMVANEGYIMFDLVDDLGRVTGCPYMELIK